MFSLRQQDRKAIFDLSCISPGGERFIVELQDIPAEFQKDIFVELFETAQIARFNPTERHAYEDSLKYYRDMKNVTDTARGEGVEEGR